MQEFPNLRYSRKVQLYQRTTEIKQEYMSRKSSADNQNSSFPLSRMLPKIITQHKRGKPISLQFETLERKEKVNSFYKKESKTSLNLTKVSFKQSRRQKYSNDSRFEVVTKQGKRPYNQDRFICHTRLVSPYPNFYNNKNSHYSLYAVFDGHGGKHCAQFLKQNFALLLSRSRQLQINPEQALKETFAVIEQKFLTLSESRTPIETSGSCAVACLVDKQKVYVANLGDSRALLLSEDGYLPLTHDHKPQEQAEKLRILKHGGKIYRDQHQNHNNVKIFKQLRVFPGNLNVSRTIGDAEVKLKKYGGLPGMISSTPDVCAFEIGSFHTLLLATDGLFQAFTNEQISNRFVSWREGGERSFVEQLCEEAQTRSSDNITVVLVHLG